MATSRAVLTSFALLGRASATDSNKGETPVEKVIELLDGLKKEVAKEGKVEAESYDRFACFCKSKTESKSESIKEQQDTIDQETATIEEKSAEQEEKEEELTERKQKHEELSKELDDEKRRCRKLAEEYEVNSADLKKALSSLSKAKESLENSKSFLQVSNSVKETLQLAEAMSLIETPKRKAAVAFIQQKVDPDDPEYAFHSDKLIELLGELHVDFTDQKDKLDKQWGTDETACTENKAALNGEIDSNDQAMETLKEEIAGLKTEISDARENLDEANEIFKDDSLYLHDLTKKCTDTARTWDQRSAMRFQEIEAIEEAVDIIKDKVQGADEDANERALLLAKKKPAVATSKSSAVVLKTSPKLAVETATPAQVTKTADAILAKTPSFLQTSARVLARSFLERSKKLVSTEDDKREKVTQMLRSEGKRLSSATLTSLAEHAQGDPFVKIKKLIQNLIERLLAESKAEASKKGFCDTELGKARHERDERHHEIFKLLASIGTNKAQKEFLEDEIEELEAEVKKLTADLDVATKLREEEHDENTETIKTAKEGLEAVSEALDVLKKFYKKAAKGKVLLQASPIAEDEPELAFGGKNTGNQDRAGGIIGMVEVIQSDFERTIRMTTQEEAEAGADFVQFERTSKADIKGKETKVKLDGQELKATKNALKKDKEDLTTETGLLDDCLKSIEELKPVCIDTGMSYAERVEKREEEIGALKSALCMLDPEGVEDECNGK